MKRAVLCSWIAGLVVALPAVASAEEAYTTTAVNLRAGPDAEYPLIRWVPEGTAVDVQGCLADYLWCDVEVYGDRGWMSASFLVYPYQSSNVPIVTYGAVIGLPLVGFTFDSYWDDHYRRRPWYDDRHRWAHRYRPEYGAPRYAQPRYAPPPQQRPPQYYPPSARPQYRPPVPQPNPMMPPGYRQPERQPDRRNDRYNAPQPAARSPGPGYQQPPAMRAPAPPQSTRQFGPPPSPQMSRPPGQPQVNRLPPRPTHQEPHDPGGRYGRNTGMTGGS